VLDKFRLAEKKDQQFDWKTREKMETVLNKAERKFVRMSWEVAKAKRSNESITRQVTLIRSLRFSSKNAKAHHIYTDTKRYEKVGANTKGPKEAENVRGPCT
jgi:hypothetical protein